MLAELREENQWMASRMRQVQKVCDQHGAWWRLILRAPRYLPDGWTAERGSAPRGTVPCSPASPTRLIVPLVSRGFEGSGEHPVNMAAGGARLSGGRGGRRALRCPPCAAGSRGDPGLSEGD